MHLIVLLSVALAVAGALPVNGDEDSYLCQFVPQKECEKDAVAALCPQKCYQSQDECVRAGGECLSKKSILKRCTGKIDMMLGCKKKKQYCCITDDMTCPDCTCPAVNCPGTTSIPEGSTPKPIEPSTNVTVTGVTDGVIFTFVNRCKQDLWMGADGRSDSNPTFVFNGLNFHTPNNGGWYLPQGGTTKVGVPLDWFGGRFWARTGCTGTGNSFYCETGHCGPWIECATGNIPRGGVPPVTLAEFTLNANNKDYFDISHVDGFNLPMTIHVETYDHSEPNPNEYWCTSPECLFDINSICPSELAVTVPGSSETVACNSACMKYNTPEYCCRAPCCGLPETCTADKWEVNYPDQVFKKHCPQAYSFAYDDATSTFFCRNTNYGIYFC